MGQFTPKVGMRFTLAMYKDSGTNVFWEIVEVTEDRVAYVESGVRTNRTHSVVRDWFCGFVNEGSWLLVNTKQDTLKLIKKYLWNQE